MIRLLLIITLSIYTLQAETKRYFIQLGSFQQLNVLEKSIDAMPAHLRTHVIVVQSNGWLVPFAYNTTDYTALKQKLPLYRSYFPDAYINSSSYILKHRVIRNYSERKVLQPKPQTVNPSRIYTVPKPTYRTPERTQNVAISEEDYTVPYNPPPKAVEQKERVQAQPVTKTVSIPKPTTQKQTEIEESANHFTKQMLSGKQFYLAYKATEKSPNLLVKVSFANHRVTYQPIIGEMRLNDANYFIDDKKLYMYAEYFTRDGAYSTLEEYQKKYMLVSSWAKGKKLNTLRYYYKLKDAKKYLGEESSEDQLSQVLEEGSDFDWGLEED